MMFLCLTYLDRGLSPGPEVAADYSALHRAMEAAGVLVASGQLQSGEASKVVRVSAGATDVSDGSPAGAGQVPSAYFVIDCKDVDRALDWASRIPSVSYGSVEVRPPR